MNVLLVILEILFWTCVFMVFHSYVLYPLILKLIDNKKPNPFPKQYKPDEVPFISIIIAAYNEEGVIAEKVQSILSNHYPKEQLEILIGSDASTDKTEEIVEKFSKKYSFIRLFRFSNRQGKGNTINQLSDKAKGKILLFTDANIILGGNTLYEMIKLFKNPEIGLVDANMNSKELNKQGISFQENAYISHEVKIKNHESNIWGTMMGPFGGCFAVRKEWYAPVPENFLVDDFFINMKILEKRKKSINNLNAVVFEDISNNLKEEYRRKVRISTGNYQNLKHFSHLLFCNIKGFSFCYISHKVIRWLAPLLLIISLTTNTLLIFKHWVYYIPLAIQGLLLMIPFIDLLLRKNGIHVVILRFITHFCVMNVALLMGFIKFMKGVKSNVWQPTQRNQL